jgi:hypothetical protein
VLVLGVPGENGDTIFLTPQQTVRMRLGVALF